MIFIEIPGPQTLIDPDGNSVGQLEGRSQLHIGLAGAGTRQDVLGQDGEDLLVFISQMGLDRVAHHHVVGKGGVPVEGIPLVNRTVVLEYRAELWFRQVQRGPETGDGFIIQGEGGG